MCQSLRKISRKVKNYSPFLSQISSPPRTRPYTGDIQWPYLNILPTQFDTLIYWSSLELGDLQGSAVLDKIGKDHADSTFREFLLPIVEGHSALFGDHSQHFAGLNRDSMLLSLAHRMAT